MVLYNSNAIHEYEYYNLNDGTMENMAQQKPKNKKLQNNNTPSILCNE